MTDDLYHTDQHTLEERFAQAQKMETIGMLAGGIAHDFNNALQAIQGFAELALDPDTPDDTEDLRQIINTVELAQRLTRQLLAFSRRQPLQKKRTNLNALTEGHQSMLGRILGEDIHVELNLADDLFPVRADAGQIEQVLLNLAVNARDAMPHGGRLSLRTFNVRLGPEEAAQIPNAYAGDFACLAVTDTGIGMPPEIVQRIFEPFFTTKAAGKGTGMGLPMSYGIIRQHDGWIHVYTQPGQGTTFKIYLPPDTGQEPADTASVSAASARNASPARILVVEDEAALVRLVTRMLQSAGHHVQTASSVKEAEAVFGRANSAFDLLFTDMVLSDGNGLDLFATLHKRAPGLRVLFTSGYADERSRWRTVEEQGWSCLMKPYARKDLLAAVNEALRADMRTPPSGGPEAEADELPA